MIRFRKGGIMDIKVGNKYEYTDEYNETFIWEILTIVDQQCFMANQNAYKISEYLTQVQTWIDKGDFKLVGSNSIKQTQTTITCTCASKVLFSKGCQCGAFFKEQSIKGVL
jgi:hypothetical protein